MATEATTMMSLMPESPLRTAIFLLIVSAVVFTIVKPDFMYEKNGDIFRAFGTGPDQTLMPFWLAVTLVGLVGYYLAFTISY